MISLLIFPFYYLKEIIAGALYVAYDVLTPNTRIQPILLRLPLTGLNPRKRLILANLITMTPGTLSVCEEEEGSILLIHSLYGGQNPKATLDEIQERYVPIVAKLPL